MEELEAAGMTEHAHETTFEAVSQFSNYLFPCTCKWTYIRGDVFVQLIGSELKVMNN